MRRRKVVAAVIGSARFFPVSRTASLFAGTQIAAEIDERKVEDGDILHSLLTVARRLSGTTTAFNVLDRYALKG